MENPKPLLNPDIPQEPEQRNENQIPKQDWPIGDLPDPLEQGVTSDEVAEEKKPKPKNDDGFDEWSVSWP